MGFRKRNKKALSDIMSDFMEVKRVASNFVELNNGDKIVGLKIHPQDVFTKQDELVEILFNRLSQVYNSCDFDLYKGFVFSPNSFATHENRLIEIYNDEETSTVRKIIIDEDLGKFQEFANALFKLEFFIMIKAKDDKNLLKHFELLQNTMARAMDFDVLLRTDYLNYLAYYFDTPLNDVSRAIDKEPAIKNVKTENNTAEEQALSKDFMTAITAIKREEGNVDATL